MTGEVRVGVEVETSTLPWVSTPPRGESFGSVTRWNSLPCHAFDPVVSAPVLR